MRTNPSGGQGTLLSVQIYRFFSKGTENQGFLFIIYGVEGAKRCGGRLHRGLFLGRKRGRTVGAAPLMERMEEDGRGL